MFLVQVAIEKSLSRALLHPAERVFMEVFAEPGVLRKEVFYR